MKIKIPHAFGCFMTSKKFEEESYALVKDVHIQKEKSERFRNSPSAISAPITRAQKQRVEQQEKWREKKKTWHVQQGIYI